MGRVMMFVLTEDLIRKECAMIICHNENRRDYAAAMRDVRADQAVKELLGAEFSDLNTISRERIQPIVGVKLDG